MKGKRIKELIEKRELVQAPGVYDALTAKIVEAQGFNAVYMTGYGTSAGQLGLPDTGVSHHDGNGVERRADRRCS